MNVEILITIIVLQTIVIVWLLLKRNKKCIKSVSQTTDKIANTNEEYKMVLLVRKDLKMQKGKIAAQCGHAAVGCVLKAQKYDPISLNTWRYYGQAKIALVVDNLQQLEQLEKKAEESNLITKKICDAGRTQVVPGSITVLGIGPAPVSVIDQITGKLKLL
ncbi:peptidyl-tRNA hydrolase, putative [Entamoeba histolytica HM-1:IMSS-B]|uniref:peptidyl-tRNA hydrolase n=6 Tax=Entamoeba histolytica TaxID=5759 RepID=C4LXA6_ENTH1|nr:hypothetical protein, conserved [Entamoeba histolytica HM-1:IMSS]EMD47403.1 peptidyl-tRNA hydrolase, putative [Entamoeba histolytica KU27]EMH78117.1 peptidyl-tRNA hydrolase, putative [Entamoeba histolytica HM-1:IMSS-B]EMS11097.1 peptidyl-tRNA hydrolase [Entamoeba histolytica HM-3:IMSS]ENY62635.1 peptidyl-tRNA hydrolase, putative [Entamoeba histolytica HM-1:IMSS-A]GAT93379.1 hypothetical protein conserved [Entamoeba histolytica]|eukprot:XP_653626.1 hypothetical protein, conserved [Entamoeba histolytica HM-1:IMSS]